MRNTSWVAYKQYGSYFRLYDNTLQACPMLTDGTMDSIESASDVDYSRCDDPNAMRKIARELHDDLRWKKPQ